MVRKSFLLIIGVLLVVSIVIPPEGGQAQTISREVQSETTFSTDFSEYEAGGIPNGWSERWAGGNWRVQDDPRTLVLETDGQARRVLTWDEVGEIEGDVEVFGLVRGNSSQTLFQLPIHVSGSPGAETSYYVDASVLYGQIRINHYHNGAYSTLANKDRTIRPDVFYRVVLQREGTTLRAKMWRDGTAEPDAWDLEVEDSALTGGAIGVGGVSGNTRTEWAFLGVGINGDAAPRAPEKKQVTFSTDFSEYETGGIPDGWSERWAEGNWSVLDDPRTLVLQTGGMARRVLTWDELGEIEGDVELFALVRGHSAETLFHLPIHVSGSEGSETSYYVDASVRFNSFRINHYNDGSYSTLASKVRDIHPDVFYRVLFQREGTTLRARLWENGTPEPDEWDLEVDDGTLSSGAIGVGGVSSGTRTEWAFLGVGIGGAEAPRAPAFELPDVEIDLIAPQDNELVHLNAGQPLRVELEAARSGQYVIEYRPVGTDTWLDFASDTGHGRLPRGTSTVTVTVPIDAPTGPADLRVRLIAQDEQDEKLATSAFQVGAAPDLLTGFEQRDGASWTTFEEEMTFLQEVAERSDRVSVEQLGETIEGRPIHLARVGKLSDAPLTDLRDQPTVHFNCSQHGNEPSGREACLQILRDLAFSDDPDIVAYLENTTVLMIPTANPDGRANNTRGNSHGIDTNRDHLELQTPEGRAMARVMREAEPDVVVDMHDRGGALNGRPELEVGWVNNRNVLPEIAALSENLVRDGVFVGAANRGYTYGVWGGGGDERISRNMFGLRHSVSILVESRIASDPDRPEELGNQIASQLRRTVVSANAIRDVLAWQRERVEEIQDATAKAAEEAITRYYLEHTPYSFGGTSEEPPCGYLLTKEQAQEISELLDLHGIHTVSVDDAVFVSMGQRASTVIPFLLDGRATYNVVDGVSIDNCIEVVSAANMQTQVEYFADAGLFENDSVVRALTTHLTAVHLYEEQNEADKVIKHMEGFKQLLDYQQERAVISEAAYNILYNDADLFIEKWQ